jgi:hypothetical protein
VCKKSHTWQSSIGTTCERSWRSFEPVDSSLQRTSSGLTTQPSAAGSAASRKKALQARLFDRKPTGYTLTATGENLVRQAEAIESLTIEISSQLAPSALALAGSVRIATPEGFGTYFLAAHLRALVQAYPEMEIELVAVEAVMNPDHVGSAIAYMASLPFDANVQFMTVMATKMPFIGRG